MAVRRGEGGLTLAVADDAMAVTDALSRSLLWPDRLCRRRRRRSSKKSEKQGETQRGKKPAEFEVSARPPSLLGYLDQALIVELLK